MEELNGLEQVPRTGRIKRGRAFPQLEVKDAHQQSQADRICEHDDNIGLQKSVHHPQRHSGGERQEHLQGEVASGAGVPTLFQLRIVRDGSAECRDQSDGCREVHLRILRVGGQGQKRDLGVAHA